MTPATSSAGTSWASRASGRSPDGLALVSALWCRYCFGVTDSGAEIAPNDPNWDRLQELSKRARDTPSLWLTMREVYGDLADNPIFVSAFSKALNDLWATGTSATLLRYTTA